MNLEIEVIIGTYEGFLLGYRINQNDEGKLGCIQSFADKSHTGSIRCLAVYDVWVATGSTDDRIFVYNMNTRRQAYVLLSHEGTINALNFTPDSTHLLSAGDDGQVIATRLTTWQTDATWRKAHSGYAVTNLSCHPSGKLVLTLGNDKILRTWNLVKGRVAYKTNIKSKSTLGSNFDCLTWSPTGDYFTLSGDRGVEIWSIKTADILYKVTNDSKPICICWINEVKCLVGLENGKIRWICVDNKDMEKYTKVHEERVKAMSCKGNILVTTSSAGVLKLWCVSETEHELTELASINIGCRPICIGIFDAGRFGANNNLEKQTITEQNEKPIIKEKQKVPPERGVVTIEYENDSEEDSVKFETFKSPKSETESEEEEEKQEASESSENEELLSADSVDEVSEKALQKRKMKDKKTKTIIKKRKESKRLVKNSNINQKI